MWGKKVVSAEREEHIDGDPTSRLTGVDEGIERLLHWSGSRRNPLFQAPASARVSGAAVTFKPGARTAWRAPRSDRRSS